MREPERLLAKSMPTGGATASLRGIFLQGHTAEVIAAARVLYDQRGAASLHAAGLGADYLPRLRRLVLAAAFLHDLGKSSDCFQQAVRGDHRQLARHEALSAFLAWTEPLRSWLAPLGDDLPLAIAAAAGHHRKFDERAFDPDAQGTTIEMLTGHNDFAHTLRLGAKELQLTAPPECSNRSIQMGRRNDLLPTFDDLRIAVDGVLLADPPARALLAVAKALVLASDVAGSALPSTGERAGWLGEILGADRGNLRSIADKRLNGHSPRQFQNDVAAVQAPLALVTAGCGSGKTAAAYLWAARNHPQRQLWLCYPTTGTALEGFRGYLHGVDGIEARLTSGRARIDLDILGLNDGADGQREADRKEALESWGDDAIACTCDTVLGLMQNQRQGLYQWPALCSAAVVFDEIHAYDDRLFGNLLTFLRRLPGIPVLLMTASLPNARLTALQDLCRQVHGRELPNIPGPQDLETVPRYHRTEGDPWGIVTATIAGGGKVLWVCNTVDRCLTTGGMAAARTLDHSIYHSRFRYEDRVRRHGAVIAAFDGIGPALAITTQVAEMSLDLSADLLVSDLAPVPALIQRLGRLNRRVNPKQPGPTRPFLVLPFSGMPYAKPESALPEAQDWLSRLGSGPLSQRDLVAAWSASGGHVEATPSAWWDVGYSTQPDQVRDGSAGITVLLESDAATVQRKSSESVRFAIPMNPPRGSAWMRWRRVAHLPVVPQAAITYDAMKGARWT